MAVRGRKPKPKPGWLKGPVGAPPRPEYLDEHGREAWDRIVPQLQALGILTELDGEALALYCATYSRWRRAMEEVRVHGVTTHTDRGALKANPAVAIAAASERLMAAILVEFGLTPSSRSRIQIDETPRDDLAEFLARRNR